MSHLLYPDDSYSRRKKQMLRLFAESTSFFLHFHARFFEKFAGTSLFLEEKQCNSNR